MLDAFLVFHAICRYLMISLTYFDISRTPLTVAADCSGRGDSAHPRHDVYKAAIAAGYPSARNDRNCLADTLETLRVLVEHGQSDPTISNANGESALSRFTGRVEHFNYLFQQEHFQVDLFQDKNEDFALTNAYASRYRSDSSKIALICLEQEKLIWEKTFHSKKPQDLGLAKTFAHMLHGAAEAMTFSHTLLVYGEGYLAEVRDLIKQVIASGADIHAAAGDLYYGAKHLTPFGRVLALSRIPGTLQEGKPIIDSVIASANRWLRALKDAGVDLKEYLREEERLATLHKKNGIWSHFTRDYQVNWRIEVSEHQEDYSVSLEYEVRERIERKEEDRIPGGWIEEDWMYYVCAIDSSVVPPLYTWRRLLPQGNEDPSSLSEGNTSEEADSKPLKGSQGTRNLRMTSTTVADFPGTGPEITPPRAPYPLRTATAISSSS
jgi:hypothetical protein